MKRSFADKKRRGNAALFLRMDRQNLLINWISVNLLGKPLGSRRLSRIVLLKQKDVLVASMR
ncbi:Hypothetical protein OINT_2000960 [Brucella intermedia LMG 3301]|uniref:Uncharacterized protein n=1 Tax=Brucella intermedia LMG 3301 TaxID=641118 RepID=C4WML8_9HYPH|nr:Hypothetical protein OINT_2000960 [Brucella intermedia LMG 3301]OOC57930.1 hypothetical protein AS855_06520 [Brucella intermedia M86]